MTHTEFINQTAEKVSNGSRFTVDFEKRTLRLDGRLVDLSDIEYKSDDAENVLFFSLYRTYKHSIPSERSDSHRRNYFKALPEKELSDEDMMYGQQREVARCRLELSLLLAIISGAFRWRDEWGSWFYQSPYDKDFIILRSWVEPKNGES